MALGFYPGVLSSHGNPSTQAFTFVQLSHQHVLEKLRAESREQELAQVACEKELRKGTSVHQLPGRPACQSMSFLGGCPVPTTDTHPCPPSPLSTHITTEAALPCFLPKAAILAPSSLIWVFLGGGQGSGLPGVDFRVEWDLAASTMSVLLCTQLCRPSLPTPLGLQEVKFLKLPHEAASWSPLSFQNPPL